MITGQYFLYSGWNFTQMVSLSTQSSQPTQRLSKFYCPILYPEICYEWSSNWSIWVSEWTKHLKHALQISTWPVSHPSAQCAADMKQSLGSNVCVANGFMENWRRGELCLYCLVKWFYISQLFLIKSNLNHKLREQT